MRWAVCQYGTGEMIILPCDYIIGMMTSNHPDFRNISMIRTFYDKQIALDYLTELMIADNLIYKALQ